MNMTSLRPFLKHTVAGLLILIGGCASQPRTPDVDASIRSVAVISLLSETISVKRIGLTAFHNKVTILENPADINEIAILSMESRLKHARPGWSIINARELLPGLRKSSSSAGESWTSAISAIQPQLGAAAQRLNVDLLFIAIGYRHEQFGTRDVALLTRTTTNSLDNIAILCQCYVAIADRSGRQIALGGVRDEWAKQIKPSDVDLDYELTNLKKDSVQIQLNRLISKQLEIAISSGMKSLGY